MAIDQNDLQIISRLTWDTSRLSLPAAGPRVLLSLSCRVRVCWRSLGWDPAPEQQVHSDQRSHWSLARDKRVREVTFLSTLVLLSVTAHEMPEPNPKSLLLLPARPTCAPAGIYKITALQMLPLPFVLIQPFVLVAVLRRDRENNWIGTRRMPGPKWAFCHAIERICEIYKH